MRIGTGYDAHRLVPGRNLILGGAEIPFHSGLDGHSDADVLIHAIIDALLGAAGRRDIGVHFPATDKGLQDVPSTILLLRTAEIIADFKIGNIDATIVAQAPHLAGFLPEMEINIAECLGVSATQVNVKATTEEHMGFTGRGEGIAAHAVCLIYKKR